MAEGRADRLGVRRGIVIGQHVRRVALTVFCPRHLRSTHLDVCRSCPHAVAIDDASVTCVSGAASRAGGLVGAAMGRESISIEGNVTVEEAARRLGSTALAAVALDADHRVLGLVHREQLAIGDRDVRMDALARPRAPVLETSPVMSAVQRMVRERARALPVASDALVAVGVVTDIDVLRWAATWRR